jgi:hypothetical protein
MTRRILTAIAGLACLALVACSQDPTYVYIVKEGGSAGQAGAAAPAIPDGTPLALTLSGSPSKGPAHAKVTIIESSDFQ